MHPLIAKLETVASLSADDRESLLVLCGNARSTDKGRDIVSEGDKLEHVYVVLDGWAARYTTLPNGSRQITAFLIPGDLCNGETVVLKKMDCNVVALTPVTVAMISRSALIELIRNRPGLAHAFWRAAVSDEAVLRAWVVNLGRRDAYARLAHLACELHARTSRLDQLRDAEADLPLTQEQLGDALGLTPVHVNRVLKRLRDEGLMQLQGGTLTIFDAERLAAAAGFDPGYLQAEAA